MGCSNHIFLDKNNNSEIIVNINIRQSPTRLPIPQRIEPYLQSNHDENFNFPEITEEIFIGKGLKKMKGYISPIPKEDLEKKREAFWGTRTEGNQQTWNFLRELCQMPEGEEDNMNAMLEAYDLIPLNNCINITYDSLGGLYEIPNYCINEPYKYEIVEDKKERPSEKKITFHLRKGIHQTKIKCSNYSKIEKIKDKIAKRKNIDINKVRLFFYGKEMKNNFELWNYNICEDCVVMMMLLP